MDHHRTSNSPSSSTTWACHSSTSGAIRSHWKLSDNWSNRAGSIGWIRRKEVTSRTSRTCHSSAPWTIQEVAEMTSPTDSRDNSSSSTWSCHCPSRAFTAPSSSSSSESTLRTQACPMRWRESSRISHQPQSSCGSSLRNSCSQHQPSSTTCSTCVNWHVSSRASCKSRRNPSWKQTESKTSNHKCTLSDCGDMNVKECSVIS